jgi:hypothetical protein
MPAGRTGTADLHIHGERVRTWLAIDQSNLAIMRCLELYESADLKKMVKRGTLRSDRPGM